MMSTKRDQIIETTCQLMEMQGYHATGLNQILAESGAPKGSLYYYFPKGKEELAVAAVERTSRAIQGNINSVLTAVPEPAAAIKTFLTILAEKVAESGYQAGGPITAIALESASTNETLRETCHDAYQSWQDIFAKKLQTGGYSAAHAARLAALIIASIEGAIILSRSARSTRPLQDVAQEIDFLLRCTHGG